MIEELIITGFAFNKLFDSIRNFDWPEFLPWPNRKASASAISAV